MKIITTNRIVQDSNTIDPQLINGIAYKWHMNTYETILNGNWYSDFIEFLENQNIETIVLHSITPHQLTLEDTYMRIRWAHITSIN